LDHPRQRVSASELNHPGFRGGFFPRENEATSRPDEHPPKSMDAPSAWCKSTVASIPGWGWPSSPEHFHRQHRDSHGVEPIRKVLRIVRIRRGCRTSPPSRPKPATARTRPNRSTAERRGRTGRRAYSLPRNGWPGSMTTGYSHPSALALPPRLRHAPTVSSPTTPCRSLDSNPTASPEPGGGSLPMNHLLESGVDSPRPVHQHGAGPAGARTVTAPASKFPKYEWRCRQCDHRS